MKKILSLTMAIMMLVSAIPAAYALDAIPCENCNAYKAVSCPGCSGEKTYCPTCDVCSNCDYTANGDGDEGSTIPEVGTTTVTLVGTEEAAASYYEVEVPATMAPGGNADVTVDGFWRSTETLKVTAPEKVTLYYGDQSIDVGITFAGISQAGNDQVDSTASANLKLADASVKFGTWTGVIEYEVELVSGTTPDHSGTAPDDNNAGSND